jgi:phosphohistidine phosphatase
MHLLVIRHAAAQDPAPGLDDEARELTPAGRAKLNLAIQGLRRLGFRFDRLLTSPWKRAAQTARLLAVLARGAPVPTPLLAQPPSPPLLALLAELAEVTAVVGHEPWLGELVAWLAFGDPKHGDALMIKKGGVVWLEGTAVPGGMQIRALLPPKLLRALDID